MHTLMIGSSINSLRPYYTLLSKLYPVSYFVVVAFTDICVETQSSVHHSIEILNLRYSEVNRKVRCNLLANSMRLHSKLDLKFIFVTNRCFLFDENSKLIKQTILNRLIN